MKKPPTGTCRFIGCCTTCDLLGELRVIELWLKCVFLRVCVEEQRAQWIRASPLSSPSRSWKLWSNSSSNCRISTVKQKQRNRNRSTPACPQVDLPLSGTSLATFTHSWPIKGAFQPFPAPSRFPEGLAPADSLNDPAAESNGHELASSSSAVTSAVARLASTFGPAPTLTVSAVNKSDSTFSEVTNGVAATPVVSDGGHRTTEGITMSTLTC